MPATTVGLLTVSYGISPRGRSLVEAQPVAVEHVDDQRGGPGEPAGAVALAAEGCKYSRNPAIKFGNVL